MTESGDSKKNEQSDSNNNMSALTQATLARGRAGDRASASVSIQGQESGEAMSKMEELWQYALFRFIVIVPTLGFILYCVLQTRGVGTGIGLDRYHAVSVYLSCIISPILSALWVWRRMWGRMILRLVRTVNKAAE